MLTPYAQEKMTKIAELRKDHTLTEALKESKTSPSAYYSWLNTQKKADKKKAKAPKVVLRRKSQPYLQEIPVAAPTEKRIVCLIGSPSEIAKIVGELK